MWQLDQKKAEWCKIDVLNCGVGEDSWESLGLQGDLTSQSYRKSILNIHWKDWCLSWSFSHLMQRANSLEKTLMLKDWGQEEKGTTENEMVGWHRRLNRHEFEHTPGDGEGQGSLRAAVHGVTEGWIWLSHWTTAITAAVSR